MRNEIKLFPMKEIFDAIRIPQIELMDPDFVRDGGKVGPLDSRVVKIVEVIEDRDFMTVGEESLDKMRTDKARAAGNQGPHRASVKMKLSTSKGRTTVGLTLALLLVFLVSMIGPLAWRLWPELRPARKVPPAFQLPRATELAALPTARRFDFPIGTE